MTPAHDAVSRHGAPDDEERPAPGGRRTRWLKALLGLVIVALGCGHLTHLWTVPLLDLGDRQLSDQRQKTRPFVHDERVVIVDIDERSLAELGRWTWPRTLLADLTRRIVDEAGAAVLGFDVVFAEASSGRDDRLLARAFEGRPVVLGYYFTSDEGGRRNGALPPALFDAAALDGALMQPLHWDGYGANLPELARAARDSGYFNTRVDDDGLVRSVPMLVSHDGRLYGSFVVSLLRQYLGDVPVTLAERRLEFGGARGARARIPLARDLTAVVPYASSGGPHAGRFRYVSAADVLSGRADAAQLRGRIVLVGSSAQGIGDRRATPIHRTLPGVEVHATLLAGALDGSLAAPPPHSGLMMAGLTLLLGVPLALGMPFVGVPALVFFATLACTLVLSVGLYTQANLGWLLPMAPTLVSIIAVLATNLAFHYLQERSARRAVMDLFGQYVSPELVARMARRPQDYPLESQNKRLTILFADIRGFTRIAETAEPQVLREYLNSVLTRLTEIVHRNHGTVDKYMGDAIMAFWGAPIDDPRQEDHAIAASIEMVAAARALDESFRARGWPGVAIGVGINSGTVRVGDMGSRLRRTYTAIGDAVNLAARLETLTKQMGHPVLLGEATARGVTGIPLVSLGETLVPGRSEAVRVYTPRGVGPRPVAAGVAPGVVTDAGPGVGLGVGLGVAAGIGSGIGSGIGTGIAAIAQPASEPAPVHHGMPDPLHGGGLPGLLHDGPVAFREGAQ